MIRARRTEPAAFAPFVRPWLLASEAEHNLLLGILNDLRDSPPPDDTLFVAVEENGDVVGAAFRTPPWKAGVTRMPLAAVPQVVELFAAQYDALPAIMGPPEVAETFAQHWCSATGGAYREHMRERIHQATTIIPPARPVSGVLRSAVPEERQLVLDWTEAFAAEAHTPLVAEFVERRLQEGAFWLWDDDGPRTLVGTSGWTPNGVRIGPVYTPPEARGRGYGSAATAAISQRMLDEGRAFCCLYTDLANPTSNAIYHRIGYEPVCDVVDFAFSG